MAKRKSKWKVGQTKIKTRKINGKRRRVKVKKLSKGKYKTSIVGKRRKR